MDFIMVFSCMNRVKFDHIHSCYRSYSPPTPLTPSSSYVVSLLVPCVSCLSFLASFLPTYLPSLPPSFLIYFILMTQWVALWFLTESWVRNYMWELGYLASDLTHWLKFLYQLPLSAYRSWEQTQGSFSPPWKAYTGIPSCSVIKRQAAIYLTPDLTLFILPFLPSCHPVFYSFPRGWEVLRCLLHCSYMLATLSSTMFPEIRERV